VVADVCEQVLDGLAEPEAVAVDDRGIVWQIDNDGALRVGCSRVSDRFMDDPCQVDRALRPIRCTGSRRSRPTGW
jgi:hypothetical protein